MQLDGRTLPDRSMLNADLCIVGAGPAGLTLAAELAGGASRVVIVESGSWLATPETQRLNAAAIEGDRHDGLEVSRRRQIGGTARLWNTPLAPAAGAKFAPLDPVDF